MSDSNFTSKGRGIEAMRLEKEYRPVPYGKFLRQVRRWANDLKVSDDLVGLGKDPLH